MTDILFLVERGIIGGDSQAEYVSASYEDACRFVKKLMADGDGQVFYRDGNLDFWSDNQYFKEYSCFIGIVRFENEHPAGQTQ